MIRRIFCVFVALLSFGTSLNAADLCGLKRIGGEAKKVNFVAHFDTAATPLLDTRAAIFAVQLLKAEGINAQVLEVKDVDPRYVKSLGPDVDPLSNFREIVLSTDVSHVPDMKHFMLTSIVGHYSFSIWADGYADITRSSGYKSAVEALVIAQDSQARQPGTVVTTKLINLGKSNVIVEVAVTNENARYRKSAE